MSRLARQLTVFPTEFAVFGRTCMNTKRQRDHEEASSHLLQLLEQAADGTSFVIVRNGKPVAALIPVGSFGAGSRQQSALPLVGTGRGMWSKTGPATIRRLRDEWSL